MFLLSQSSQMRANIVKPPSGHNSSINRFKKTLLPTVTLFLVTIILLHHMHDFSSQSLKNNVNIFTGNANNTMLGQKCNIFRGTWIPFPQGPYYTNESGCVIEDTQNCMKFGRPDNDFMKWRWKPDACELPLFDAAEFFKIVRGKSMAFVGDSVARNHAQSLQCLLSSVARSVEKTDAKYPRFKIWFYPDYDFTLALALTTHLVNTRGVNSYTTKPVELYLDEVEEVWAGKIENFNYVIISAGHWFSRPLKFFEINKVVGCNTCTFENITFLNKYYGYRKAFRTAFRTLIDLKNFKGTVILRTITPGHFESADSYGRGNCIRTRPYKRREMKLDWEIWMFYLVQVEEFFAAQREGKKRGLNFRLLDITDAMRPRADGHPNHYGHLPEVRFMHYSDCLHWCLPGAIDLWNELLLQMLKTTE